MKPFSFKERLNSFRYAFKGIWLALGAEHNFIIHLLAALFVILIGFYFNVSKQDWLWLTIAIALVLITEMINTAIERLVDLVEPNQNPLAGKIKDMAAAAVLIAAMTAVIIGLIILLPYIFA